MRVIFDLETYPNFFSCAATHADGPLWWYFEISDWRNDREALFAWLRDMLGGQMVGFNNLAFDYPILHRFIGMGGKMTSHELYAMAQHLITSQDEDKFANMIYPSDRYVAQIDLMKIMHFDNKARMTSLKVLEFNMRLDSVEDLPFPVGSTLTESQAAVVRRYNEHDVLATKRFYEVCLPMIQFREELTAKHGKDFINHNDVKIGKEIFQMSLEAAGVPCYVYGKAGRRPRQTLRATIPLKACIPEWVTFNDPEFKRVHQWLTSQVITETKGVFKDLVAHVSGLDFVFGTGGLHASVDSRIYHADEDMMILDLDVTSMYPSIAISQGYYPEHLGRGFVDTYITLKEQRVKYPKGSAENAMLKLALNGVYGASNDAYSVFFDPKFTMCVTLTGQMALAMLAEKLTAVGEIIQVNTDGITIYLPRKMLPQIDFITYMWEETTGLQLERVEYKTMCVRDVNSYIAQKVNGEVKRKGAYEYAKEWHQDQSALVVAKVAEKVLLENVPIRETLLTWPDKMDFMSRIRVPRSSRLVGIENGTEYQLPNLTRYYVSKGGCELNKLMPPLKGKTDWRRFKVEADLTACPCNHVKDAVLPIDYEYYIREIEKLTLGMRGK